LEAADFAAVDFDADDFAFVALGFDCFLDVADTVFGLVVCFVAMMLFLVVLIGVFDKLDMREWSIRLS
jgi:hypothetical protein